MVNKFVYTTNNLETVQFGNT